MSQTIFTTVDPTISGTALATLLNDFKDAVVSGMSGATRPTELDPGGYWVDTSGDPTTWVLRLWTGVDDVQVAEIDLATGTSSVALAVDSFIVKKVSADTVGAIMELVKRRIATNGQVLSGDVVGEVRFVGRDNAAGDPVVAKILYTAGENQTSSAFGGTLDFYSTPLGQNALVNHMRFITGIIETIVPHKLNSQILVGQNVATTATITQLSAAKVLVEMTGSTATEIQGINSAHDSKVVHIHNRSSANVVLSNQDAGAAAADRMLLPEGRDITMLPQESVTLYYCTADTRWKILYASSRFEGFTNDTFRGNVGSFVAPAALTKARITAHSKKTSFASQPARVGMAKILDVGKELWAWGLNTNGAIGDGTVIPKSAPTAVLGGLKFIQAGSTYDAFNDGSSFGLTEQGLAYAWGRNVAGELGVGDVIPRSSPVAVVGGHVFRSVVPGYFTMYGLAPNGDAYAWGGGAQGGLGDGTSVSKSSPVAVVGGLKFQELFSPGSSDRCYGLTLDNDLYAWGTNAVGELGVGDTTARSSPVAVLGGLKFRKVVVSGQSVFAITTAGALFAWGYNANGQLGLGDRVARSTPTAVVGGLTFRDVAIDPQSGAIHVLGLTEAGAVHAWGDNTSGQLGDGTVVHKSSPVAVLGGLVAQKILTEGTSFTGASSFLLTEDGSIYAWGVNTDGQLGTNDVTPRSSPVAVVGGLSFQDMAAVRCLFGESFMGLTYDGSLYAWGRNSNGELGVGDTTPRSSPVAVLGGLSLRSQDDSTTILDIPIVGGNTYAIKLGVGPCFFGNTPIGNDVEKVEVTYIP